MATIIGFAGGGGIGLTLTTYFGSLQYHKAGTVVACIVIVVAVMDFAVQKIRQALILRLENEGASALAKSLSIHLCCMRNLFFQKTGFLLAW